MIRGLMVCPDCNTLLVDPRHQPIGGRQCDCEACFHVSLFDTPEGRSLRSEYAKLGVSACAVRKQIDVGAVNPVHAARVESLSVIRPVE